MNYHPPESQLTELARLLNLSTGRLTMLRSPDGRLRLADGPIQPPREWTDPSRARELYNELRRCRLDAFASAVINVVTATRHERDRCRAIRTVIKLGISSSLQPLVSLLHHYDSAGIAEIYLNSESGELADAAHKWAYSRGYRIEYYRRGAAAKWGVF